MSVKQKNPCVTRVFVVFYFWKNPLEWEIFLTFVKTNKSNIGYTTVESTVRSTLIFHLIEKKTKKKKRIDMTPDLQREFKAYIEGIEDHEYLFKSREGVNKPISRSMAYKILRAAAEYVGLDGIGTHWGKHSDTISTSKQRTMPCWKRFLITLTSGQPFDTSGLIRMPWTTLWRNSKYKQTHPTKRK